MTTQIESPGDAIQPPAPLLEKLRAEEHRLAGELSQLEDNWKILDFARKGITAGIYRNGEWPWLEKLWEGCRSQGEKSAAIEPVISQTLGQIEEAKRQLTAVRVRLADATFRNAKLAAQEATVPALRAWADAPAEIQQGRLLAAEQRKLGAAIEHEEQRLKFWRGARGASDDGSHVFVQGDSYARLTFACFSAEEKVARVDGEVLDATAKLADFRKRDAEIAVELARLRRVLLPRVRQECRTRGGRLDALLREAEAESLALDAISGAVADIGLPFRLAAYPFFRGDSRSPSSFRQERLRHLEAGALEQEGKR